MAPRAAVAGMTTAREVAAVAAKAVRAARAAGGVGAVVGAVVADAAAVVSVVQLAAAVVAPLRVLWLRSPITAPAARHSQHAPSGDFSAAIVAQV